MPHNNNVRRFSASSINRVQMLFRCVANSPLEPSRITPPRISSVFLSVPLCVTSADTSARRVRVGAASRTSPARRAPTSAGRFSTLLATISLLRSAFHHTVQPRLGSLLGAQMPRTATFRTDLDSRHWSVPSAHHPRARPNGMSLASLTTEAPNHALPRTRPSRRGCNPTPSWAGSLSLGR